MKLLKDCDLTEFNTFKVAVETPLFIVIENLKEIEELDPHLLEESVVLGGGSNVLFVSSLKRPVLHITTKEIEIKEVRGSKILVEASAGVKWDDLVKTTLKHHVFGVENLSGIPGTVGGAVVQNIGAYGVEIKDYVESVTVFDKKDRSFKEFKKAKCQFSYRDSIFKRSSRFIVVKVVLALRNRFVPILTHSEVKKLLATRDRLNAKLVRETILSLRKRKLPDVKRFPNAGSFFKNPVVNKEILERLLKEFKEVPYYETEGGFKIPAGWLIEKAGLKGKRYKNAMISSQHALVIVNLNDKTGEDILELALYIKNRIKDLFGISLVPEVKIITDSSSAKDILTSLLAT